MNDDVPDATVRRVTIAGGGEPAENEDASAVRGTSWPVRVAVADGATESAYARVWARRVAEGVVDTEMTPAALREALSRWQDDWSTEVRDQTRDRPWYVRSKVAEGAFSTVLGLRLNPDGQWRAVAVGDSCLFHVRNETLERSWPLDTTDEDARRPALIPSRPETSMPSPAVVSGTWRPQDCFLLATDAVAEWLLRMERDVPRLTRRDEASLRETLRTARDEGTLPRDDSTLLILALESRADRG